MSASLPKATRPAIAMIIIENSTPPACGAGIPQICISGTRWISGTNMQVQHNRTASASQPLIKIPIASHIAQTLDKIGDGLEGKTKPRRLSPAEVAALLEQKRKQTETEKLLAAERCRQSQQLFAKRNIDRTPVASIPPKVSPGFTEVRANSPGFREIPRWRPQ